MTTLEIKNKSIITSEQAYRIGISYNSCNNNGDDEENTTLSSVQNEIFKGVFNIDDLNTPCLRSDFIRGLLEEPGVYCDLHFDLNGYICLAINTEENGSIPEGIFDHDSIPDFYTTEDGSFIWTNENVHDFIKYIYYDGVTHFSPVMKKMIYDFVYPCMCELHAYVMGASYNSNSKIMFTFDKEKDNSKPFTLIRDVKTSYKKCKIQLNQIRASDYISDFIRGFIENPHDTRPQILNDDMGVNYSINKDIFPGIILNHPDVPKFVTTDTSYVWLDVNALEFVHFIYHKNATHFCKHNKHNLIQKFPKDLYDNIYPFFKFVKSIPNAVTPSKNRYSDAGFDLTVVSKIKENKGVHYYDTGIKVQPPYGYYFDMVGRSSISKTGWMLANNIGIIDASYRGNIIVALVRVSEDVPEITLPMRLVQLIPRKLEIMDALEIDVNDLIATTRDESGFGSSGN